MSRADVVAAIAPLDIPYAYIEWPDDIDIPLPCIVYAAAGRTRMSASNRPRVLYDRWSVTYYSQTADDDVLDAIEDAIGGAMAAGWPARGDTIPISIGGTRVKATEFTFSLPH